MQLIEATVKAKEQLQALLNRDVPNVTSASKVEDGWQLTLELIERKAIPDSQDLLGMYEVFLNEEGYLTSYERVRVRKRMDLEEVVE
jgi:hypothetical protein